MLDQSSFDLIITQSEYRVMQEKIQLQQKQIHRLQDSLKEKEQCYMNVVDRLNKAQEIVRNLSYNSLKLSRKYIQGLEEKQKCISYLNRELSSKDVRIKQYSEIENRQKQVILQLKNKLSQSQQSLKQSQLQDFQKLHKLSNQYSKLQQSLNKLKRSERLRINQQRQQLSEIVANFIAKVFKEGKNIIQEIIQANNIHKQILTQIFLIQNLTYSQGISDVESNISIFNNIFAANESKNELISLSLHFLQGKVKAILVQAQKVKEQL